MSEVEVVREEKKESIREDLVEYGESVPHQILIAGDVKTGKSTVAKYLS